MKILAINNYDLEWAYKEFGDVPMHQTWGVSYFREKGHQVDTVTFRNRGGQFESLKFNLQLWKMSSQYDVIISFFTPCIHFLAYLKALGLVKARLYTFVHHHGKQIFLSSNFYGLIYLSKNIKMLEDKQNKQRNSYLIDWNPELNFYKHTYEQMCKTAKERYEAPVFVSTGKSSRNHELVKIACNELKCKSIIFDKHIEDDEFVITEESKGYHYMLEKMSHCAVNIVPCRNRGKNTSLCGLTSVIDGLALGMPLLMSDNTNISFDIEQEGFGLYYKADDLSDLKEKMQYMISHPHELEVMGKKAKMFAEQHDYLEYCRKLFDIVKS